MYFVFTKIINFRPRLSLVKSPEKIQALVRQLAEQAELFDKAYYGRQAEEAPQRLKQVQEFIRKIEEIDPATDKVIRINEAGMIEFSKLYGSYTQCMEFTGKGYSLSRLLARLRKIIAVDLVDARGDFKMSANGHMVSLIAGLIYYAVMAVDAMTQIDGEFPAYYNNQPLDKLKDLDTFRQY